MMASLIQCRLTWTREARILFIWRDALKRGFEMPGDWE